MELKPCFYYRYRRTIHCCSWKAVKSSKYINGLFQYFLSFFVTKCIIFILSALKYLVLPSIPFIIIDTEEPYTAALERRLKAAETVSDYGYKVGFHFDPLIMSELNSPLPIRRFCSFTADFISCSTLSVFPATLICLCGRYSCKIQ